MDKISELEAELLSFAIKRAKKEGLTERDSNVSVKLYIKGNLKSHQNWSTEISEKEWEAIMSLKWESHVRKLLLKLKQRKNEPLTGAEVEEFGISVSLYPPFKIINESFKKNCLPFHFAAKNATQKRARLTEGKFCLFNKFPNCPRI